MSAVLAAGGVPPVVFDLLIVLATASVVGLASRRIRLALIPGYLIAGALIGPGLLGLIEDSQNVSVISDLAIVLLMFTIGMTMSREEIQGGLIPILGVGVVSTLGTAVLLTPAGLVFGLDAPHAIALAMSLSMSSTAVVLRLYQQRRELRTAHGRIAFGTLLTQDLLVVLALATIPLLARWAGVDDPEQRSDKGLIGLLGSVLISVGAIGVLVVGGAMLLPRVMREASRERGGELMLLVASATALGAAGITGLIGFSPELGAFIAGLLLAGTPFRHQLAGQLGPVRDLFMAVFFTAVGLRLDPAAVGAAWWVVPLGVGIVFVVKTLTIGGSAWAFGTPPAVAATSGISLAQAGEFSLIVLFAGVAAGLFGTDAEGARAVAVAISIVIVSLILTPSMLDWGRRAGAAVIEAPSAPWIAKDARRPGFVRQAQAAMEPDDDEQTPLRVVIAGFGPVGRALAERFTKSGAEISVIEMNAATVRTQQGLGQRIVYGDATNRTVLEEAGVESADAVVLTFPDEQATIRSVRAVRALNPGVFIAARTGYLSRAFLAKEVGADHVTVEELATADAMQRHVMEAFEERRAGADENGADRSVE